jgi:hypothetical protein
MATKIPQHRSFIGKSPNQKTGKFNTIVFEICGKLGNLSEMLILIVESF